MAKYLLNKAYEKEIHMSITKLQKMLFALDRVLLASNAPFILLKIITKHLFPNKDK